MDINYNEIDLLCIPMVKFFNEQGLTTKFSCQGHNNRLQNKFEIIFDDIVTDQQIYDFLSRYSNKYNHTPFLGHFIKWARKMSGKITTNWIYSVSYGNEIINQGFAKQDLEKMRSIEKRGFIVE